MALYVQLSTYPEKGTAGMLTRNIVNVIASLQCMYILVFFSQSVLSTLNINLQELSSWRLPLTNVLIMQGDNVELNEINKIKTFKIQNVSRLNLI